MLPFLPPYILFATCVLPACLPALLDLLPCSAATVYSMLLLDLALYGSLLWYLDKVCRSRYHDVLPGSVASDRAIGLLTVPVPALCGAVSAWPSPPLPAPHLPLLPSRCLRLCR